MNNAQILKWAGELARSVNSNDPDAAIREIYRRTVGRDPTPTELRENRAFFDVQSSSYKEAAKNGPHLALADLCQVMFSLNEFVYLP
jgi:hypothetical protein